LLISIKGRISNISIRIVSDSSAFSCNRKGHYHAVEFFEAFSDGLRYGILAQCNAFNQIHGFVNVFKSIPSQAVYRPTDTEH